MLWNDELPADDGHCSGHPECDFVTPAPINLLRPRSRESGHSFTCRRFRRGAEAHKTHPRCTSWDTSGAFCAPWPAPFRVDLPPFDRGDGPFYGRECWAMGGNDGLTNAGRADGVSHRRADGGGSLRAFVHHNGCTSAFVVHCFCMECCIPGTFLVIRQMQSVRRLLDSRPRGNDRLRWVYGRPEFCPGWLQEEIRNGGVGASRGGQTCMEWCIFWIESALNLSPRRVCGKAARMLNRHGLVEAPRPWHSILILNKAIALCVIK